MKYYELMPSSRNNSLQTQKLYHNKANQTWFRQAKFIGMSNRVIVIMTTMKMKETMMQSQWELKNLRLELWDLNVEFIYHK